MKKYSIVLVLVAFLTSTFQYPILSTSRATSLNHVQTQTTPQFQTSIPPLEINSNGTKTISVAGEYYLTSDVDFHPVNNSSHEVVFHITTSNVSLNLNGKQITQDVTNPTAPVRAIVVDPGLENIVIHNGSIHDFSGGAIIVGQNCKNVTLHKLSIVNCKLTGIVVGYNPFDTGTYPSVFDAQQQIRCADPNANGTLNSTQDIVLDGVYVSGVTGYDDVSTTDYAHAIGIELVDVKNFQILNSISNSNQYGAPSNVANSSTNPGGQYVADRTGYNGYGIHMVRCQNGHIENSEGSCNQGYMAVGFLAEQSNTINFVNCVANHNTAIGDPVQHAALLPTTFDFVAHRDLGRAAGFMLNDSSGNVFEKCDAFYTKGTRETAGFWLRRYQVISSDAAILNSQLFDPTIIQDQLLLPGIAGNVDIGNVLLVPPTPNPIPTIGSGYNVTQTPVYLQHSGSNCNRITACKALHTSSTYLGAHGFLSQANTNNSFTEVVGQNSTSGIGSDSYLSAGSISDFDTGIGLWSLTEYDQYQSPHTNKIIQYATGITLESLKLPLSVWNGTKIVLADAGGGDLLFVGTRLAHSTYALPCWSETCSTVCQSTLQENYGSCVGAGVGILLNGTHKSLIKKNWLYCNHSCSLGTTSDVCEDNPSGIGALGGYGLLDLATSSTALIMENLAFANQVTQPKVVTLCCDGVATIGVSNCIEGRNYHVQYSDPSLKLPIESASIGDFSPFNILTPFSNFQWDCQTANPNYLIKDKLLVDNVARVFSV